MNRRNFLRGATLSLAVLSSPVMAATEDQDSGMRLLADIDNRLKRLRSVVGFGNFNVIGFDQALRYARTYSSIGAFTKRELQFIEILFYADPAQFGFYGKRTCNALTQEIPRKEVVKVPYTGHYIYKDFHTTYEKICRDVGESLILTSGVRSVVKQLSLFVSKVRKCDGSIALASHSIAPPGYSYHSIGDFDVGKVGFGWANFTSRFAQTEEFKKLIRLNYIDIRYRENNRDGVRYEPWHVKMI